MKILILVGLSLVCALFFLLLGDGGEGGPDSPKVTEGVAQRQKARAPASSAEGRPSAEVTTEASVVQEEEVQTLSTPAMPRKFFPGAKVLASVRGVNYEGAVEVVKTLETEHHSYVRLVETYRLEEGREVLTQETAMVANQLLVQRPELVAEDVFLTGLATAGAREVKSLGEAYLVTFEAKPQDPNALADFQRRVKEVMGDNVIVEPNYLRRLI